MLLDTCCRTYQAGNTCRAQKDGLSFVRHCSLMLSASVNRSDERRWRSSDQQADRRASFTRWLAGKRARRKNVCRERTESARAPHRTVNMRRYPVHSTPARTGTQVHEIHFSVNAKTSSARHTSAAVLKDCGCKRHGTLLFEGVPEFRAARPQTNASETGGKEDRGQGSRRAERNQSADGAVGGKSGKEETER